MGVGAVTVGVGAVCVLVAAAGADNTVEGSLLAVEVAEEALGFALDGTSLARRSSLGPTFFVA